MINRVPTYYDMGTVPSSTPRSIKAEQHVPGIPVPVRYLRQLKNRYLINLRCLCESTRLHNVQCWGTKQRSQASSIMTIAAQYEDNVPVIDLSDPGEVVVQQIGKACATFGKL